MELHGLCRAARGLGLATGMCVSLDDPEALQTCMQPVHPERHARGQLGEVFELASIMGKGRHGCWVVLVPPIRPRL